jgi:putative NADPH-quinone reductase
LVEQILTIVGTARADGNTAAAGNHLRRLLDLGHDQVIDLRACELAPFSYEPKSVSDDFPMIVEQMLRHRHIVFATPVYWYAMSGLMKTLFDRFTDLLAFPEGRPRARSLAGREVWLLATGTDEALPAGFEQPFASTARYFDMRWREAFYLRVDETRAPDEQDFSAVDALAAALDR